MQTQKIIFDSMKQNSISQSFYLVPSILQNFFLIFSSFIAYCLLGERAACRLYWDGLSTFFCREFSGELRGHSKISRIFSNCSFLRHIFFTPFRISVQYVNFTIIRSEKLKKIVLHLPSSIGRSSRDQNCNKGNSFKKE